MRSRWQNIDARDWRFIRDVWVAYPLTTLNPNEIPSPGLEDLPDLRLIVPRQQAELYGDVPGIRSNALAEAVFLYKKCSRSRRAAQELAISGSQSWALFNAYHSAYIGARGIMALLGFATPKINGSQAGIDFFPITDRGGSQGKRPKITSSDKFRVFSLGKFEQRFVWEALIHLLNISTVECWNKGLVSEITDLNFEKITPPRNLFLYKANYWPLEDLVVDLIPSTLNSLVGSALEESSEGFLLRLCFTIFQLFSELIADLASTSNTVLWHMDATLPLRDCDTWSPYPQFIDQLTS
jgi:hypothetical protein